MDSSVKIDDLSSSSSAPTGLTHAECLKSLHDEITQVLEEFRERRLKPSLILDSFLREKQAELIHNFLGIFLCSLSLFISFSESFFPNTSNAIFLLLISFFNLSIIILVYLQTTLIIYNKAKILLSLIESKN
jgi:hypothetical protein